MSIPLRYYNLVLFVLHLVLAGSFTLYFSRLNEKNKNTTARGVELSIREHQLEITKNEEVVENKWSSANVANPTEKSVQNMVIAFFAITAFFHLYYYLTDRGQYASMINSGNNYIRWVEYSITSTLMLLIIALSSGVKDRNVYALLIVSNVAMIAQGQLVEDAIRKGENWIIPMTCGFALLVAEFGVIINCFFARVKEVDKFLKENTGYSEFNGIPKWLYAMIFVLFAFFSSFGFISLWGSYSGAKYEKVERLYLIFSLVAKATLGAFVGYGLAQRGQEREE